MKDDTTDKTILQPTIVAASSNEQDTYYKNELEIEPDEPAIVNIHITAKKYSIIYAKPSWTDNQSLEELLKLPVERITAKNCALFIWINAPRFPEALNVINQWGFEYETIPFVGIKIIKNNEGKVLYYYDEKGEWTYEDTVFCIVATKGTIKPFSNNLIQAQIIPLCHDKSYFRPKKFKEFTVQLLGALPALELFPDLDMLNNKQQFHTEYNGQLVEWDMAASREYLVQLAKERRTETHNIESST